MALFGRKKPQELYAEAERYVKLVADWLKQPLAPMRSLEASDLVTAEYYTLAICTYLAQEKVSPSAREYLAEAVVRNSTYSSYVKDLKKECGFMAVVFSTLNNREREARKSRSSVLQALADNLFKDFSTYKDKETVKRVVYSAINLFVEEIEPTNYRGLRLNVPTASCPAPQPRTSAPAPSRTTAPKAADSGKKADYVFRNRETGEPMYFDKVGNPFVHEGVVYQAAMLQGNNTALLFLDVSREVFAIDDTLCKKLAMVFIEKNPAAAEQLGFINKAPDHPTEVTLSNGKGETMKRRVMGWMEFGGKEYAITTDLAGKKSIMVLVRRPDGHLAGVDPQEGRDIFAIFRDRHPAMFK